MNDGQLVKRGFLTITSFLFNSCLWLPVCLGVILSPCKAAEWQAGVASVVITPDTELWQVGYSTRKKPAAGKLHDLHAKALALQDPQGTRLVIVTTDLVGIVRSLRDSLLVELAKRRLEVPPEGLLLNASHTHGGPLYWVGDEMIYIHYGELSAPVKKTIQDYTAKLQENLLAVVSQAIENLAPAELVYGKGHADFAMNRRLLTRKGFRNAPNPDGPVDHDVPVLHVKPLKGEWRAVLFGYACHNTAVGGQSYLFNGDYAGFAQAYLEEQHPGLTAMFLNGCSGDQNPQPHGPVAAAKRHGEALGKAVETVLAGEGRQLSGTLGLALEDVSLALVPPPSRQSLERQTRSGNPRSRRRAEVLLEELTQNGRLRTTYPYPVQVIGFGNDLTLVAMGSEPVVGYGLRIKKELAGQAVWVAGYSNEASCYVPTAKVLAEGGYEGRANMYNTIFPGPWAPSIEERIIEKIHHLVNEVRGVPEKPHKD
ncbi:MAG: neutral/alkaline non-lysosomal ceramidase N-terminal domain-containing protein [Phycisphaerae bacterium]|nr:neutral/alkaline non-lysosomal ceramidase N-terminal domain-containing protein [Phycisphaerae bacterium]